MGGLPYRSSSTLRELFEVGLEVGKKIDLIAAFLRAVLETAFDPIILVDERGVITDLSVKAAILFGYEPHELIDLPLSLLVPGRFRDKHLKAVKAVAESTPVHVTLLGERCTCAVRKDGSEVKVTLRVGSYRSPAGLCHVVYLREVVEV